ncbi:Oidioi.mRNA.OKI2018_I69.PAR.g12361.t1.cds [Oikopleura dioica]|uniref:Oidioi.mRNA.OKI2018_I69.PAR.g12361.t1.cds n=1 Tax=Oikopleura dioica TaxID=34765 RepID=A0ABN7S610_OIKDI|nr:Oidioi.mRNA.OKI2018_I69.PAR.g12361.t1.cds [Oikopleura dioica]
MFKVDGSPVPAFGLALHNDELYFAPWYQGDMTVYAVNRESKNLAQVSRGVSPRPFSMIVVHKHMQKSPREQGIRFCEKQNSNDKTVRHRCSHLCANIGKDDYVCLCPSNSGLVLAPDGKTCVIPDQFLLVTSLDEGTISLIPKAIGGVQIQPDDVHDRVVIATSERPSAVVYDPVDEHQKILLADAQYSGEDGYAYVDPPSVTWIYSPEKNIYEHDSYSIPPERIRLPFGVTGYGDMSWFTDWELGGIVEIDPTTFGRDSVILKLKLNLSKPTGIFFVDRVSANVKNSPCLKNLCSHICVPDKTSAREYYCSCPKNTGLVIGTDGVQCKTPERFLLVADMNRILLQTLEDGYPDQTPGPVILYESPNMFSNIAGVVYDPIENYVYWSDNGIKHIARRKFFVTPPESIKDRDRTLEYEVMPYIENIGEINALTFDVENRLLVWTDSGRGSIEILSLRPGAIFHATAAAQREFPMGVALDATTGKIFWTEMGKQSGIWEMDFNGSDKKQVVPKSHYPASIVFDSLSQEIVLGDAKTVEMESYTSADFAPIHSSSFIEAGHLFSIATDGSNNYFSDWETQSVHTFSRDVSQGNTLIKNLIRPTQLFFNSGLAVADNGICMTNDIKCSHICLPADDGYDCKCPDNLYLAANYETCVATRGEIGEYGDLESYLDEYAASTEITPTTSAATTTTAIIIDESDFDSYVDNFNETDSEYDYDISNYDYEIIEDKPPVTSVTNSTTTTSTVTVTTPTTPTTTTGTTTETLPEIVAEFANCPEYTDNGIELQLDGGYTFSTIDNTRFNLTANSGGVDLDVVRSKSTPKKLRAGKQQMVEFEAYDSITNDTVKCGFLVDIIDTEPPRLVFCPNEMVISSFRKDLTSYVEWPMPEFKDNLGASNLNITMSHEPGFFPIGIHEILITATDQFGNSATCGFEVMVKQERPKMGCGYPPKPPNSELMCQTDADNFVQHCQVFCSDGYENALYLPQMTCNFTSLQHEEHIWLPALDANVCQKPAIAGASKTIQLTYDAPCIPDPSFYKSSIAVMKPQIQNQPRCETKARAGFCERPESFLQIECENEEKIRLNITVEIEETENMKTTATVLSYLDLVLEDIRVAAVEGSLTLTGSDQEEYIAQKAEELPSYSAYSSSPILGQLICDDGHKVVKDGCLKCPKGSRLYGNECELCRIGEYQEIPGTSKCFSCPAGKTTISVGTTSIFKCIDDIQETSSLLPFVIAGCAAGFIILLALVLCIVCVIHKKKRERQRKHLEAVQRHARNERAEQEKVEQLAQLEREREAREAEFARQRAERRAMMNALTIDQENQEPIPVENESENGSSSSDEDDDDDIAKPSQVESESGEDNEDDLDAEVAQTFEKAQENEPKSILRKVSKYEKGQAPSMNRMGLQSSLSMRSTNLPTASALNQMNSSGIVRHASIAGSMTGSQMMMMPPNSSVQRTPSMNLEGFNQQMMLQQMMTQGNYDMVRPSHQFSPAIATPPDSTYDVPRPSYPGSHVGSFVGSQGMPPPQHNQMSNMPPQHIQPPPPQMNNPHQRQGSYQGGFADPGQIQNFNQPQFMEGPPQGQMPNGFGPPGQQIPPHMQGPPGPHPGQHGPGPEQYDNMQFNNVPPFNMGPGPQGFY